MSAPTEKDLEQKQVKNEKLREQIAEATAKAAAQQQEQSMILLGSQLDAETARLETQLAAAKEAAKVTVARKGAAGPLAAVEEQLRAAQSDETPVGVVVDTNAETGEKPVEPTDTATTNTTQIGGNS